MGNNNKSNPHMSTVEIGGEKFGLVLEGDNLWVNRNFSPKDKSVFGKDFVEQVSQADFHEEPKNLLVGILFSATQYLYHRRDPTEGFDENVRNIDHCRFVYEEVRNLFDDDDQLEEFVFEKIDSEVLQEYLERFD